MHVHNFKLEIIPGAKCWDMAPVTDYGWAVAGEFEHAALPTSFSFL